ncbi:MAG: ribosomal subunit interface protein [Candidatus Komeilibacteria bacterium RIFCSPLOWO2_01_FULL_52_15]|uniref:Ribosomal subunit interface protein n=2 Tax=Candidatus Komeiliibacteriota TaxID=1817908 RepID=A0A1G2BQZ9_9BACT|nr:MAG: ribosomal subunit interface protein [Candidatus Komeilibacteria bacterium RIFCSPHIGHO2_01_FULL_52_14]OGY91554.1 MAG: ribosomal subunit interface protein [Candidatus Komeilibacteria bacterium RIFCSPLOWO2_01_FULL_52_15]
MEYQVYSKNVFVTDSLSEYLRMKMAHIDKLSVNPIACRVDVSRDAHHRKGEVFRIEINMTVPNRLLRIVEVQSDMRAAIDIATDKLLEQLKKYKSKAIDLRRGFSRLFKRQRRNSR